MAPDTPGSAATPTPTAEPPEVRDKVRIRFTKGGALRLLSHHDLMRAFERMLRRAALPFRNSQGFHPKPRIVFALSLPLGVVGREEVVELELSQILPLDELRRRLTAQCPPGLELLSFRRIEARTTAQVKALTYRIALPPERVAAVQERVGAILAATECWVERTRPPVRRVDLRAFVRDLRITGQAGGGRQPPVGDSSPEDVSPRGAIAPRSPDLSLEMDLWLMPQGTARPEEVLTVLGVNDLLDAGALLERARLELTDETESPPSVEGIA
jgi:radical SAM-linked protein